VSLEMVCLNQEEVIERQQKMILDLLSELSQFREIKEDEKKFLKDQISESWDSVSK
jgi:hypothetical protein